MSSVRINIAKSLREEGTTIFLKSHLACNLNYLYSNHIEHVITYTCKYYKHPSASCQASTSSVNAIPVCTQLICDFIIESNQFSMAPVTSKRGIFIRKNTFHWPTIPSCPSPFSSEMSKWFKRN